MAAARRLRALQARHDAARDQPSRLFVAIDDLLQSRPRRVAERGVAEFDHAVADIRMPATVHGGMQGTARTFQESLANEPLLIVTALVAVYIVLGILYESYRPSDHDPVHPAVGRRRRAARAAGCSAWIFSVIALIGVILLIGIVKKNAIMMIDFALEARARAGLSAAATRSVEACLLRFRPIMMTTMAALSAPSRSRSARRRRRDPPPARASRSSAG